MRLSLPRVQLVASYLNAIWVGGVKGVRHFGRQHPRISGCVVALMISLGMIWTVDRPVALYVGYHAPENVKDFFRAITDWAKGAIWFQICGLWLLLSAWGLMRSGHAAQLQAWRDQARFAWFFLCALIFSGIALLLAKFVIGRYRPKYLLREDTYGFLPFNLDFSALSYPSGHTQVIFCVATVLATFWPRMTLAFFALATVLGFSRVMVSAHYPADVVMGACVGSVVTLLVRDRFLSTGDGLKWYSPYGGRRAA